MCRGTVETGGYGEPLPEVLGRASPASDPSSSGARKWSSSGRPSFVALLYLFYCLLMTAADLLARSCLYTSLTRSYRDKQLSYKEGLIVYFLDLNLKFELKYIELYALSIGQR
jgi:hypothetical protein